MEWNNIITYAWLVGQGLAYMRSCSSLSFLIIPCGETILALAVWIQQDRMSRAFRAHDRQ